LSDVRIAPWGPGDLALLEALNAPEMTAQPRRPREPGFTLLGAHDFEYRGSVRRCNDWRPALF
jgi:hypothetical protein